MPGEFHSFSTRKNFISLADIHVWVKNILCEKRQRIEYSIVRLYSYINLFVLMKKPVILLLICFIALKGFSQNIRFETRFSEPFAVFQFINSLSATRDNVYKKLFSRSAFFTKKYTGLIAQYDSLNINYEFDFTDYPAGQKVGIDVPNLLRRNLILCDSLSDFRLHSMGLVPNAALLSLINLIKEFTPVYKEVIYKPSKNKFEEQLRGISDLMSSSKINYYFTEALQFYNSSWDVSVPFIFCFYPLPESRGFTATAISDIAISAVADSLDNYKALLTVMLHEISHILYDERSRSLWNQSDEWFHSNHSKVSRYGYSLFNEAMATAVGNGFLATQLNGKEDTTRRWYGNKYISMMAKTAYPIVKEYISNRKPIDQSFVNEYIRLFEEHYTDWLSIPEFIMMGHIVYSENPADFQLTQRLYSFSPNHEYENQISFSSLKKLSDHHGTKLLIVNKNNNEKLELIKSNFPELADWHFDAGQDFVYCKFLHDKTWLIVLNNVHGDSENKLKNLVVKETH